MNFANVMGPPPNCKAPALLNSVSEGLWWLQGAGKYCMCMYHDEILYMPD